MAVDSGYVCRTPIYAGTGHSLRQHCEEKMGSQFCIHVAVRVRCNVVVLGYMGVQDVIRRVAAADVGESRYYSRLRILAGAGEDAVHSSFLQKRDGRVRCSGSNVWYGGLCAVPVLLRRYHSHPFGRVRPREDELPSVDAVCALVARTIVHRRSVQLVGRGVSVAVGGD